MKKFSIIFIVFIVFMLVSCSDSSNKYKYDYSKLEDIALNLKSVYTEMVEINDSIKTDEDWTISRPDLINKLEEIQYDIDLLPITEKEPKSEKDKKAIKFNNKLFAARDIKARLQDIQELLYSAALSNNYRFFKTVTEDYVIEARLDNLIERCQNNGLRIPLDEQYQNIPLPDSNYETEIEVEFKAI